VSLGERELLGGGASVNERTDGEEEMRVTHCSRETFQIVGPEAGRPRTPAWFEVQPP